MTPNELYLKGIYDKWMNLIPFLIPIFNTLMLNVSEETLYKLNINKQVILLDLVFQW